MTLHAQSDGVEPLVRRIVSAPLLAAPEVARARLDTWFAEVDAGEARELRRLLASNAALERLVLGLADGSPYLWELAAAESKRLLALLKADPDEHLRALLAGA